MSSDFVWTVRKETAALTLAKGGTQREAAEQAGATDRAIRKWLGVPEFSEEVDRLSLMVDIASRAHRLRLANRVIRQFVREKETIPTSKDLLDWLKYAQGETDGVKLDLLSLLDAYRDETQTE